MRVLWYTTTPLPAVARRVGSEISPVHPWVSTLLEIVREHDDLAVGIACLSGEHFDPFDEEGVRYYCLTEAGRSSKVGRVAGRWDTQLRPQRSLGRWLSPVLDYRPDLVHVFGTEFAFGLLAGASPCPCVVSFQGVWNAYAALAGRGVDWEYRAAFSPALFIRGLGQGFDPAMRRVRARNERTVLRTAQYFMGRTRFDRGLVQVLAPSATYLHCDEPIRAEFWSRAWSPSTTTPTVFSLIGTYVGKGLHTLLESCALARRVRPEIQFRFAGSPGGVEGQAAFERRLARLGLEESVTLLGRCGAAQLADELSSASVCVFSSHCENSPNSLAEAMIVGAPCVATSVGGVPSLARDRVEALLVQDGDSISLAASVLEVIRDGCLATRLSETAREAARARHDPRRVYEQLLTAYTLVLQSGSGRVQ